LNWFDYDIKYGHIVGIMWFINFFIVNYPFLDGNIPSYPAYGVYMSQLIRYSRACNSYQDCLHRSVLLTRKLRNQGFIETRLRSTLKMDFGRYRNLTLPYRVSATIYACMASEICMLCYCCHVCFNSLIRHWGWVLHAEQEMLIRPEHLISPLVFIEVDVVLSFVSHYFM